MRKWFCRAFGHWWRYGFLKANVMRDGRFTVWEEVGQTKTCRVCGLYEEFHYDP